MSDDASRNVLVRELVHLVRRADEQQRGSSVEPMLYLKQVPTANEADLKTLIFTVTNRYFGGSGESGI